MAIYVSLEIECLVATIVNHLHSKQSNKQTDNKDQCHSDRQQISDYKNNNNNSRQQVANKMQCNSTCWLATGRWSKQPVRRHSCTVCEEGKCFHAYCEKGWRNFVAIYTIVQIYSDSLYSDPRDVIDQLWPQSLCHLSIKAKLPHMLLDPGGRPQTEKGDEISGGLSPSTPFTWDIWLFRLKNHETDMKHETCTLAFISLVSSSQLKSWLGDKEYYRLTEIYTCSVNRKFVFL